MKAQAITIFSFTIAKGLCNAGPGVEDGLINALTEPFLTGAGLTVGFRQDIIPFCCGQVRLIPAKLGRYCQRKVEVGLGGILGAAGSVIIKGLAYGTPAEEK